MLFLHTSDDYIIVNLSVRSTSVSIIENIRGSGWWTGLLLPSALKLLLQRMYTRMHVKTTFRIMITFDLGHSVYYHFWDTGFILAFYWKMIYTEVNIYREHKLRSSSFIGTRVYYKSEMMGTVRPQGVD
jgi:hypothetical protein